MESQANYLPTPLLLLDNNFSHHVVIAEKSTHKLHVFKNNDGKPQLVKTYQVATGKKAGNKIFQGDHRTPEGVYYLTQFLTHENLVSRHGKRGEIYGVGAFVLNYPNSIDNIENKTGGGIWLHSTNDETRIDKGLDSRGCVVSANTDLIEISKYIELHKTPIIVVHNLDYLNEETWTVRRNNIMKTLDTWLLSWQQENIENYISHYHPLFRNIKLKGLRALKSYKKAIFNGAGTPKIEIENMTILGAKNYVRVTFVQKYTSNTISDIGRKTLYLKEDQFYQWKIVAENWSKNGLDNIHTAEKFEPSQRFFTTNNPKQIMGDKLLYTKRDTN
jgi:murein L,D-transpeptidase YafK